MKLHKVTNILISILTDQCLLLKMIHHMKNMKCNVIFKDLYTFCHLLITEDHQEEIAVKILKSLNIVDLADIMLQMSKSLQTSTLISLKDSKQSSILELLEMRNKNQAISNITNYQK